MSGQMKRNRPHGLAEGSNEYVILSALISSARMETSVEIAALIDEFIIYEHIEKPYLTMLLQFLDQANIIQLVDFQGGEKLTLKFQQIEEIERGNEIQKEFLIDRIESVVKADERNEVVMVHCTEYHMFESSVQNISKVYTGAPSIMIQKIISSYLSKQVVIDGNDSIGDMQVIIPNLHPIEASMWLRESTLTNSGLPFFLYSTLGVQNLILRDFEKMLSQPVSNIKSPYIFAPSLTNSSGVAKFYSIEEFKYEGTEDLHKLIRKGLVGAQYSFIDVNSGVPESLHFDIENLFTTLTAQNLLGGENSRYNYGPEYEVKDQKIASYNSKVITRIGTSAAFRGDYSQNFRSYQDESNGGDYNKRVNSKALKGFLAKTPLIIKVKGREFISGNNNFTLGKAIRIIFLDNDTTGDTGYAKKDLKKSGDYIIIGAKHVFNGIKATTELTCGKIASLGQEIEI